jgi:hypothetical protein
MWQILLYVLGAAFVIALVVVGLMFGVGGTKSGGGSAHVAPHASRSEPDEH